MVAIGGVFYRFRRPNDQQNDFAPKLQIRPQKMKIIRFRMTPKKYPTKIIERPNFEGGHPQWGGFGDPNWIFRLGLAMGISKVNYVSRPLKRNLVGRH